MEGKGTQLWTLSGDAQTYERNKNLLTGRLANRFSPDQINGHTLERGLENLVVKSSLDIIDDGCDLRKPYSKSLPHLTSVKALDGDWVNGYNSFNSVAISDVNQEIHLLRCTPYCYADPHFNRSVGAGFGEKELIQAQIQQTDQALKESFAGIDLWHLLDRKHDEQATFELIDGLESYFVIRLKANRNSNETKLDSAGKTQSIKLLEANLDNTLTQILDRFVWKNRLYQQAKLTTTYGKLRLAEKTYQVVRIQVCDREGQPIFSQPMRLLTNAAIDNHQQTFQLYQRYLKRSKIEADAARGCLSFSKKSWAGRNFRSETF